MGDTPHLPDISNDTVMKYKLNTMSDPYQWFFGRPKGWLTISTRNWQKVKAGDIAVLAYRIPEQMGPNRLPYYRTAEILVTVKHISDSTDRYQGDVEFVGPDGKEYTTCGPNLVAIRLS